MKDSDDQDTRYSEFLADRPRILPSNRKLKHLQGIILRNLIVSPSAARYRGKTIDDDAIPSTHRSPNQLLNLQQASKLVQSRSHTDLKSLQNTPTKSEDKADLANKPLQDAVARTPIRRQRRRSTLDWSYSSPRQRQIKLEEAVSTRMADLFFSLHVPNMEKPLYVSEIIEHTMNPNFRFFDLALCNPAITRLDQLTICFWSRESRMSKWKFLIEMSTNLRLLQFLGKDLEHYHKSLPINCILFHMSDGLYGPSELLPDDDLQVPVSSPQFTQTNNLEPTSSYDALMRLSTLEDCIQDALTIRENLADEIRALIQEDTEMIPFRKVTEAKDSLYFVENAVLDARKQIRSSTRTRDILLTSLQSRREAMQKGRDANHRSNDHLNVSQSSLKQCKMSDQQSLEDMTGQRRRICEDLLQIYPIEAIPQKALSFTIRGLYLPNSAFDSTRDENTIAAALGMVAHLVYLLSFYLSMPLPYPIQPFSSTSLITDPVSLMAGSHVFPLFMKGSVFYRFEYGVFLLNKNIELLSAKLGLTVMDIRQTLPNLKYLLYVATAGQGDLPIRKAGGVRAFLRGPKVGSVTSSRRGSNESGELKHVDGLRRQIIANGHV